MKTKLGIKKLAISHISIISYAFFIEFYIKLILMIATKITKPIVYGTIATWLGRKADEKKTHSWICYVRGVNNEDLS